MNLLFNAVLAFEVLVGVVWFFIWLFVQGANESLDRSHFDEKKLSSRQFAWEEFKVMATYLSDLLKEPVHAHRYLWPYIGTRIYPLTLLSWISTLKWQLPLLGLPLAVFCFIGLNPWWCLAVMPLMFGVNWVVSTHYLQLQCFRPMDRKHYEVAAGSFTLRVAPASQLDSTWYPLTLVDATGLVYGHLMVTAGPLWAKYWGNGWMASVNRSKSLPPAASQVTRGRGVFVSPHDAVIALSDPQPSDFKR